MILEEFPKEIPAAPDSGETEPHQLELNHGTCALAVQFDTEEWGTAHGFRLKRTFFLPL